MCGAGLFFFCRDTKYLKTDLKYGITLTCTTERNVAPSWKNSCIILLSLLVKWVWFIKVGHTLSY